MTSITNGKLETVASSERSAERILKEHGKAEQREPPVNSARLSNKLIRR